ncbi:MAG TPA: hypothetical protein VFG55_08600 [Rhodanobacteraceae bacterium]|nr:hypothetical protein [Rhodanobacteraceae bacterium]
MKICAALALFALMGTPMASAAPVDKGFERVYRSAYRDMIRDAARAYDGGDYDEAFTLFRRNACAGDKSSQAALGEMYLLGQGVARNDLIGYAWLKVAAEFRFPGYQSVTRRLHDAMTPGQREIADARADELIRLYGLRATGMSCNARASRGGHITDSVVCTPREDGSMVRLRRCEDDADPALP